MNRESQQFLGVGFATHEVVAEICRLAREMGVSEEKLKVFKTPEGALYLRILIAALVKKLVVLQTEYLRQLFVGETISIDATDGTTTIAEASDVFAAGIDLDFIRWGLNVPSRPTKATEAIVCEMTTDGTFVEIFGSFRGSLDSLCWEQSQIVDFAKKHKDRLRGDTFFLFKVGDNFFVARVHMCFEGYFYAYVESFLHDELRCAGCRHRFVVPQLTV